MILYFSDYSSPFCFLLIEFHLTFSIPYKILTNYVYYYCILIRLSVPALLLSILTPLFLQSSSVSLSRVFWKIFVHEFPISYSHTEWYFLFSDSGTTCAQETFETRNSLVG